MQYSTIIASLAIASSAYAAGAPNGTSICDYYTKALLGNTNATNEATLLTLLVNTVVIGNYTKPKIEGVTWPDVMVPGILKEGEVNGTKVNLLPYFDGGLASSNRGGSSGVAVNFLDGGAAEPLMMNKPANDMNSNQYYLLTHLYQFFGTLLGCSSQGMEGFSTYKGHPSMYNVHKFMALDYAENTYFITQVALAAASFGVAQEDIQAVGMTLGKVFNHRCAPAITLAPALGSQLQSICIAEDCPVAMNSTCAAYGPVMEPGVANSTLAMGEGNKTSTATMTAPNGGKPTGSMGGAGGAGASGSSGAPAAASSPATGGAAGMVGSGLAAGLAAFAMVL